MTGARRVFGDQLRGEEHRGRREEVEGFFEIGWSDVGDEPGDKLGADWVLNLVDEREKEYAEWLTGIPLSIYMPYT